MIYCISDLFGDHEKFKQMLKKLRFNGRDTMYVLGNVIGGESGGMELLLDMMMRENVYPIIGGQEYAALGCLDWLMNNPDPSDMSSMDADIMRKMTDWIAIGGEKSIAGFRRLDEEQREMIVDYLSDFSLYEEVEVEDREFVLVHAGIGGFDPEKSLDDYDIDDFIYGDADYGKTYFTDRTLVTGHTPTRRIYEDKLPMSSPTPDGEPSRYDKIFVGSNHIAINCGVDIGGRLGAIRLDDMKEFYVD